MQYWPLPFNHNIFTSCICSSTCLSHTLAQKATAEHLGSPRWADGLSQPPFGLSECCCSGPNARKALLVPGGPFGLRPPPHCAVVWPVLDQSAAFMLSLGRLGVLQCWRQHPLHPQVFCLPFAPPPAGPCHGCHGDA